MIGGTSAEYTLKTAKLASARYLDGLPTAGTPLGHGFRDLELEAKVLELSPAHRHRRTVRRQVLLPRRARRPPAAPRRLLPGGHRRPCSADRQALGKITADGIFLEQLEHDPAHYLPAPGAEDLGGDVVEVDLNQPMNDILGQLTRYPIKTRLSLSGTLVVARDIAHAKIKALLDQGQPMPEYLRNHPVYYAGPAKTPAGMPSGSSDQPPRAVWIPTWTSSRRRGVA